MSRPIFTSFSLAVLLLSGCASSGGHGYWLYPEPHLEEGEDVVFVAQQGHQVLSIDGQETAVRCFGEVRGPQPYGRQPSPCYLHIAPGEHELIFSPTPNSRERVRITFDAEPGKRYTLDRSACRSFVDQTVQSTCLVNVVEMTDEPRGGEG